MRKNTSVFGLMLGVALVALILTAVGCATSTAPAASPSVSPSAAPSKAAASTQSPAAAPSKLDAFKAKIEQDVTKAMQRPVLNLPQTGPKAVPGKKVVEVPSGFACDACTEYKADHEKAFKLLGWDVTWIDGQYDPSKAADGIERAISLKADGVFTWVWDAAVVLEPLRKLKQLGIPAGGAYQYDTNEKLYQIDETGNEAFSEAYLGGQVAYKLSGGKVRALMTSPEGMQTGTDKLAGLKKFIQDCKDAGGDCEFVAPISYNMVTSFEKLSGLATQVARANPSWNVLVAGNEVEMDMIVSGLQGAGLDDPAKIGVSLTGYSNVTYDKVRKGGLVKAGVTIHIPFTTWASADDMNRIFAGQKPLNFEQRGMFYQVVTKDNVANEHYHDSLKAEIEQHYTKLWGK